MPEKMCGRYYIDDETAREMERIVKGLDARLMEPPPAPKADVYPAQRGTVIRAREGICEVQSMKWGFPGFQKKGVIFNARSEGVLEKRMFQESARNRRCIVPARGFYEWDRAKNKVSYERRDGQLLCMGGIWNCYGGEDCFVILTTQANDSVSDVHERMPLVLEEGDVLPWLLDEGSLEFLLHKVPAPLQRVSGFVQQTLPFL